MANVTHARRPDAARRQHAHGARRYAVRETSCKRIVMQRALFVCGMLLIAASVGWRWLARIPFGRLPGDIHVVRDGFSIHFPLATCIVISVALTLLFWLLRR
jgi:hypothetical protein